MEESFNLQATHDFLIHRFNVSAYDHFDKDGGGGGQVVSRTFLGALLLSLGALPAAGVVWALGLPKIFLQVGVRLMLAWAVCSAVRSFSRAAARRSGWGAGVGLLLAAAGSPHYMFYASRTLPNTFAAILVAHCASWWVRLPTALPSGSGGGGWLADPAAAARRALCGWAAPRGELCAAAGSLVLALVWFRCDMLVLIVPVAASWLLAGRATAPQLAFVGGGVGVAAVAVSVAIDSALWGRLLWPEAEVLYKNVILGEMNNYPDTKQPWHYYFSKALPLGLLGALPLVPLGLVAWARAPRSAGVFFASLRPDGAVCELALPALAFIALYSLPANKQDRFVLPAYPLLFYAAGAGGARVVELAGWLMAAGDGGAGARRGHAWEPASPPWLMAGDGGEGARGLASPALASPAPKKKAPSSQQRSRSRRGASPAARGAAAGTPAMALPTPPALERPFPGLLRRALGLLLLTALAALAAGSAAGSAFYVATSSRNYPGGVALQRLYAIVARNFDAKKSASLRKRLPWRPIRKSARSPALPPCPEGDVTGSSNAREWWRMCLFGSECPPPEWTLPDPNAPITLNGTRICLPLGEPGPSYAPITVHVSNLAAQTGVSRYGEGWGGGATWAINKTEHLNPTRPEHFTGFDFLIAERRDAGGASFALMEQESDAVVEGDPRIDWDRLLAWPPTFVIRTSPKLYLLARVA